MFNIIRILLTILTIAFSFAFSLLATATEVDFDLEINPEIRGQLINKERIIKDNQAYLNRETSYMQELRDELIKALIADDRRKLQNIFRMFLINLQNMQSNLEAQDARLEDYRLYLLRVLKSAKKRQAVDKKTMEMGTAIYMQIFKDNKTPINPKISRILHARSQMKELKALNDKLPTSPYGSILGLKRKQEMIVMERNLINLRKDQYAQLEGILSGIKEEYADKELAEVQITESDYREFLEGLNKIVDILIEEPIEPSYLVDEDAGQ